MVAPCGRRAVRPHPPLGGLSRAAGGAKQDAYTHPADSPIIDRSMTERRALTILFADVSGSTKLFEARGDEAAMRIVGGVLVALAEVAARHGGRVVKTIGDEI